MYRCELCGTVVPPRSKSQTIVTEKREKAYAPQQRQSGGKGKGKGKGRRRWRDGGELPGGRGWEIVKEALVCGSCAQRHEAQDQEARAQAS